MKLPASLADKATLRETKDRIKVEVPCTNLSDSGGVVG